MIMWTHCESVGRETTWLDGKGEILWVECHGRRGTRWQALSKSFGCSFENMYWFMHVILTNKLFLETKPILFSRKLKSVKDRRMYSQSLEALRLQSGWPKYRSPCSTSESMLYVHQHAKFYEKVCGNRKDSMALDVLSMFCHHCFVPQHQAKQLSNWYIYTRKERKIHIWGNS